MRLGNVLATTLLLTACAGSTERDGEAGLPQDMAASLEVNVTASTVRVVLHVTNVGESPIVYTFPTSQRYDFVVMRGEEEVWRWSEGAAFLQVVSRDTLAPGESWDMEAVWDPGTRSGRFTATGVLTAREHGLRQSAAFELR